MGNSAPWGIAGKCCFASTAEEWWSRRLCELSQGWAFFFSDVQEMHPRAGEGGGHRHARGSRTRKPDAEQQGGAFDPLSGVGIPPGYINWCIHPPCTPGRRGWRGPATGSSRGSRTCSLHGSPTHPVQSSWGGRFQPASRYGYTPGRH